MRKISARLLKYNEGRDPQLLAYKFRFMQENMFRFFRGSCPVFYEDLAASGKLTDGPVAWICGDLHLENFGSYKGSNGLIYFDLNDFDEAVLAPATWETVRMATSIFIAFESLKICQEKAVRMARLYLKAYRNTLIRGKADYVEKKTANGIICDFLEAVSRRKQKVILAKRTHKNKKLLPSHPKHLPIDETLKQELKQHVTEWLEKDSNSPYNYKVVDIVARLAGTSSIGLNRYAILLKSTNKTGSEHLLIDMKEAIRPSLGPFVPVKQPVWPTSADRIFFAQHLMQNRTPALLSTSEFKGKSYMMQEMQSIKDNINFKLIRSRYRAMCEVLDTMGMLTASAQLRSAGRARSANADALVAFGARQDMDEVILDYAARYAQIVKKDYKAFKEDFKAGVFKK